MEIMEPLKDIVIVYHDNCMDGFGAAWSAWKKYGDNASYIPAKYSDTPISDISGKELYIVDFSYPKDVLIEMEKKTKRLVVLDHHITAHEAIISVKEHVYGEDKSGAYLAWEFFHPNTKVPRLIEYISDSDTWTNKMPQWEEVNSYIYRENKEKFSFDSFENSYKELETEEGYKKAIEIGSVLRESHMARVEKYADKAELVSFEGYQIYTTSSPSEVRGELGHILAEKTGTFSLIFWYEKGIWKCSLRSVKDFDVTVIAKKYKGGGHKNAAAFTVPTDFPLPFAKKVT